MVCEYEDHVKLLRLELTERVLKEYKPIHIRDNRDVFGDRYSDPDWWIMLTSFHVCIPMFRLCYLW